MPYPFPVVRTEVLAVQRDDRAKMGPLLYVNYLDFIPITERNKPICHRAGKNEFATLR